MCSVLQAGLLLAVEKSACFEEVMKEVVWEQRWKAVWYVPQTSQKHQDPRTRQRTLGAPSSFLGVDRY